MLLWVCQFNIYFVDFQLFNIVADSVAVAKLLELFTYLLIFLSSACLQGTLCLDHYFKPPPPLFKKTKPTKKLELSAGSEEIPGDFQAVLLFLSELKSHV